MTEKHNTIRLGQKVNWLDADTETPISLYLRMFNNEDAILLESAEVDGRWGRYSVLAGDFLFIAKCVEGNFEVTINDNRLSSLKIHNGKPFVEGLRGIMEDLEIEIEDPSKQELPPITCALYGFLGFGMASIFNPHLQKIMPKEDAKANLGLPGTLLVFDHLYNRLCQISLTTPKNITDDNVLPKPVRPECEKVTATPTEAGYKKMVMEIREKLRQGEAIQIVPSVRFCAPFKGSTFELYRKLRKLNPSPYMFYMKFPQITLFGSSPELMVRCSKNILELSPIAGTRKRGSTPEEDKKLEAELLADPKDRAEHVMLVDLGRNDLGRLARSASVQVREYMQIQKFSHVMHLTSNITANLRKKDDKDHKLDALDVLAATFPAGTVSGAPKFRAMEIIREMENKDRGPYAGCIGWIGLQKNEVNLDMGITIRSLWEKDGKICWQAGGGIVHDSDPELEWKEVWNKSAIMRLVLNLEDKANVSAN